MIGRPAPTTSALPGHGRSTRRTLTRRTLLRAAVAAAGTATAGGAAAGCAEQSPAIRVVVVWNSGELARFQRVLAGYATGSRIRVISAGDDIDAFLRARHHAGSRPDVAVLPRPGLVTEYAARGWLAELDDSLAGDFHPGLGDLLRHEGRLYGVWVKTAHKSLFWYQPELLPQPPRTWDELVTTVRRLAGPARRGLGPAPLAIGAADGWVLTDWFENVLAGLAPASFYNSLAHDPAGWRDGWVRATLDLLAQLWSVPGAFPAGGRRALLTQYQESVVQVVTTGQAMMVFGADFFGAVANDFDQGRGPLRSFPFPRPDHRPDRRSAHPVVLGGDAAVVLRGSPTGGDLVNWLAGPESFRPWIQEGGYLSPHRSVPPASYPDRFSRELATAVAQTTQLRFDLSDQLPSPFTGSDGVGIWRIMQDFFSDVTEGGPVRDAIDRTIRELGRAAEEARAARQARRPR